MLDPRSFRPPYGPQLRDAVDPNHRIDPKKNEEENYVVLQVIGVPWELPLSQQQIEAFVYAMSNVTGAVWQYRGAQPAVPGLVPSSPVGIPPLTDVNSPTAMAPPPPVFPPPPPPEPVAVPEPFVDPNLPTLTPDPVVEPVTTDDPAATVESPVVEPVPEPVSEPVEPAVPAVPGEPTTTADGLKIDPSLFGRRMLRSRGVRTASRRRRLQSHDPYRSEYQDCSCYGDYENCDQCDYSGGKYGNYGYNSPDPYGYNSPDPYGYFPYAQPSPPPFRPPFRPPVQPRPPVVPVVASPPPPPPAAVELPPDTVGIWYFAVRALDKTESQLQTSALKSIQGEATMRDSLVASGITSAKVLQTRYAGPEIGGVLDVTQALDLEQLIGEEASDADSGGVSGATIGIIIGCIVGGLILIALLVALIMSYNKRKKGKDRDSLTNQWKAEREMAEAESKRLSAASSKASIEGSLRWTASQQNGSFKTATSMTRDELERRRSLRAASTAGTTQRINDGSAFETQRSPSRMDSMRSALGLSRSNKGKSSPSLSNRGGSSALGDAEAESTRWNLFKK